MFRTENALILREVRFKESDRILTVLTADAGKLTLSAHGALSKKSRIAAAGRRMQTARFAARPNMRNLAGIPYRIKDHIDCMTF